MQGIKEASAVALSVLLTACGGGAGGSGSSSYNTPPDTNTPKLEITTVGHSSESQLIFDITSESAGTLAISGDCGDITFQIAAGVNELIVPVQQDGVYSDCLAMFQPAAGGTQSYPLPDFLVDTNAPEFELISQPAPGEVLNTPAVTLSVNEPSFLTYTGACTSEDSPLVKGENEIKISGIVDGSYDDCGLFLTDEFGHQTVTVTLNQFTLDTKSPDIEVLESPQRYVKSENASATLRISERSTISFKQDCLELGAQVFDEGDLVVSLSLLDDGLYQNCIVTAQDQAGNITQVNIGEFSLDNNLPEVVEITPASSKSNSLVNPIVFSVNEPGRFDSKSGCIVQKNILEGGNHEVNIRLTEGGEVTSEVCAISYTDLAGNVIDDISFTAFSVDVVNPTLLLASSVSSVMNTQTPVITLQSDEVGTIETNTECPVLTSGADVEVGNNSLQFQTVEGVLYSNCNLRVKDLFGNSSDWLILPEFRSDVTAPVLTLVNPPATKVEKGIFTVELNATEAGQLSVIGSCSSELSNLLQGDNVVVLEEMSLGRYTCGFNLTDEAGNKSETVSLPLFEVVPASFELYAWQSATGSVIETTDAYPGYTLHRSREQGCNIDFINYCELGQSSALDGVSVEDTSFTKYNDAYVTAETDTGLKSREVWLTSYTGIYTAKESMAIPFKDKLFLFGSNSSTATQYTMNGMHWTTHPEARAFGQKKGGQVVEFDGKLWVIGGGGADGLTAEVWSSTDGFNWRLVTEIQTQINGQVVKMHGRKGHQVIVFQDELWLIGGENKYGDLKADVWSSSNGQYWTRRTDFAPIGRRTNHKAVVYNEKIYVVGGASDVSGQHDGVWSYDGVRWTQESTENPFGPRFGMDIEFYNGKWYLIGGYGITSIPRGDQKDIWQSEDLVQWEKIADNLAIDDTTHQEVINFNGKLWLTAEGDLRNSDNATDWIVVEENSGIYTPRHSYASVSFNGYVWLIGGYDGQYKNDIYRSLDGMSWEKVKDSAEFSVRSGHEVVEFSGKLWLIGGYSDGELKNDIWVSDNGINWTLANAQAAFSARAGHMLVANQYSLFLMGGDDADSSWGLKDVWKSSNGIDWQLITDAASYTQNQRPDAVYFNDMLVIADGRTIYTADPAQPSTWTSLTGPSYADYHNEMTVFAGTLFMYTYSGRMYSTSDLVNWKEGADVSGQRQLQNYKLESHNGHVWRMSGRVAGQSYYWSGVYRYDHAHGWQKLFSRSVSFL